MDGRPEIYRHQRAEIRLTVRADALLSCAGRAARGRVRNLSAGGVEISNPVPRPAVGDKARLALISGDLRLDKLEGEVVRETATGVALRFTNVDAAKRREILQALQRM